MTIQLVNMRDKYKENKSYPYLEKKINDEV